MSLPDVIITTQSVSENGHLQIAGSFTNWSPLPMEYSPTDNTWNFNVSKHVEPEDVALEKLTFKFISDSGAGWFHDGRLSFEDDGFGGFNNYLVLPKTGIRSSASPDEEEYYDDADSSGSTFSNETTATPPNEALTSSKGEIDGLDSIFEVKELEASNAGHPKGKNIEIDESYTKESSFLAPATKGSDRFEGISPEAEKDTGQNSPLTFTPESTPMDTETGPVSETVEHERLQPIKSSSHGLEEDEVTKTAEISGEKAAVAEERIPTEIHQKSVAPETPPVRLHDNKEGPNQTFRSDVSTSLLKNFKDEIESTTDEERDEESVTPFSTPVNPSVEVFEEIQSLHSEPEIVSASAQLEETVRTLVLQQLGALREANVTEVDNDQVAVITEETQDGPQRNKATVVHFALFRWWLYFKMMICHLVNSWR
ncbi:hypothetical protein BABINDRAFT_15009 [Babjeviella inositovora NRRL Y-12698]|uniref:AMP-activated protein kinase glycogen-binding domain-containing protein n=1 Tax=Babjeviella inositovora NRRL Y-12698 TaxID=984486 RepID=A0A1E3QK16_9ASCO|nr:uncharacterized protein BABINDRAFT_15009 [Babjeviella inositovora NRRL Y-12698]ODQ78033.1 hypothetical protein BABINDRAFT_15009 [Babjeviella inositovora NRRL Y-12698]